MATKINENGMIEGTEMISAQFLHGSKDVGSFPVKVIMDGAPIELIVKHALKDAIIQFRKRVTNRAQAEELINGVKFIDLVTARPKDANTMAASLNVDELSPERARALFEQLAKLVNKG